MKQSMNLIKLMGGSRRIGWLGLAFVFWSSVTPIAHSVAAEQASTANESSDQGLDPDNLPAEMSLSLEQLLNDPEAVAPDIESSRCIRRRSSGVSTEILDTKHLLFKSSVGNRAWLNRLRTECIGLRPEMILVIESRGTRLCQLDSVFGVTSAGFPSVRSAQCSLGSFEPITMDHAEALEATFNLSRKALAESRRQARRAARTERKRRRREAREARKLDRETAS